MSQFFKQVFSSCLGSLLGLTAFTTLGIGGLIALIVGLTSQDTGAKVKDKTMLVLDLSKTITDNQKPATLAETLRDEPTPLSLRQVIRGVEAAEKDSRIVGIFLRGQSVEGGNGYATLTEVRKALEKFHRKGKKIIAYDLDWSEKEYYLASVADTIALNPMGILEFNGLSTQSLFLAGAFDKYGVGVQVVRVGSYKGAVEPYTRQNYSLENREQTQVLLNDIWNNFLNTVAKSRQQEPQKLQALADQKGVLTPTIAKESNLIDQVAYFDEVVADIRKLTGQEKEKNDGKQSFRQISLEAYSELQKDKKDSGEKIAVLYAEGEIVDGLGDKGEIGSDRYGRELRKLRENNDIKAVVLRINSPGGSASASDVILREIYLLNQKKPVTISMGNVAASGGYWIATGGRKIFAEETTITGSIGVFGLLFNIQEIANKNGLQWDTVKTGKLADFGTNTRPQTPEELKIYQGFVNQIYDLFIARVANARKLPPEKVKSIAQGRVWSGGRAKSLGLVDQIGGLESAIAYTAEAAKLGKNWQIVEYPEPKTLETELILRFLKSQILTSSKDPLAAQWLTFKKELEKLGNFNDPQGIYTILPFTLDIK
jgi:protease-4